MVANARVLGVDDEDTVTETVRRLFSQENGIDYVGSMQTADQLVRGVRQTAADVVVLDLNMPGKDPFDAIEEVQQASPMVRIIILSGDCEPPVIRRALDAGVHSFISKDEPLPVLASALCRAATGERTLSPKVREMLGQRIWP